MPAPPPLGCCVFCITKCKLILFAASAWAWQICCFFILVARMKFNGFHFVVVCNDPATPATPMQHAKRGGAGYIRGGLRGAMQNISCCFAM